MAWPLNMDIRRGLRLCAGLHDHTGGERGERRRVGGGVETRAQLRRQPEITAKPTANKMTGTAIA